MTDEPNFPIENIPVPTKGAGGRPRDVRLDDICRRAVEGLACGQFEKTRQAARHFTPEYMGEAVYAGSDRVTINGKVQDLKERIEEYMNAPTTAL